MRYKAIAEYYDYENEHHPMLREDVPFFMGLLPKRRQSILEIGAGTGRAAIPLAQAGHRVVGVDYAQDMLAIAQRKRTSAGLRDKDLALIHADALMLDLKQHFDWVCIFFNTALAFTELHEQDALLHAVVRHLKPRGRFFLDIFNPDLRLLGRQHSADLEPTLFHVPRYDRTVLKTTELHRDPARQRQRVIFHYTWIDAHGRTHRQRTRFAMTWIFPRELQLLLERNGLKIDRLYGNYDGSPVTATSPRIIALCGRA